jgi:hypothetical protein
MNLVTLAGNLLPDRDIVDAIMRHQALIAARVGVAQGGQIRADSADGSPVQGKWSPQLGVEIAAQMWKAQNAVPIASPIEPGKTVLHADSAGMFFERQLEWIDPEILREKYKKLNSMSGNFPINTRVPPGARTYTIRRVKSAGRAKIMRNNDTAIPNVAASRAEESFPIIYGAVGIEYNLWDEQSATFANTDLGAEFQMTSERAIGQLINEVNFNGDVASGLFGLLNYPHLSRFASSVPFDDTSTPDAILAALMRGANFAYTASGATFQSDTVGMAPRGKAYLSQRYMGAGAPQVTILEAFLAKHATVKTVVEMHELQDSSAARRDKFLFYAKDRLAVELTIPQPYVLIPGIPGQMRRSAVAYCAMGGAVMRDSGNNCLMTASVAP